MDEVMDWRAVGNKLTNYSKSDQMNWVFPEGQSIQKELFE